MVRELQVRLAPAILEKYSLCRSCLSRQSSSSRKLKNIEADTADCYICNGLMSRIDRDLKEIMLEALDGYSYNTFLIGAVLPSSMLEHEDEIRAKFKIKGSENVKSYLTKELGKKLSSKTGKRVEYSKPDVTIKIDLVNDKVLVTSRAIFLFGRYVKRTRGLSQKQQRCTDCMGKGCLHCSKTGLAGFNSIEGIITKKLIEAFKCEGAKFAWVGGEDKNSLVLNEGRPFFVKVIHPKLRFARPRSVSMDGVEVRFLKRVERFPSTTLRFQANVKMLVESDCDERISPAILEKINYLTNHVVTFAGKRGNEVKRKIHRIKASKSKKMLIISMVSDGGITIKQFVSGDNGRISPSISEIIGCEANCKYFDILGVKFADASNLP